VVEALTTIVPHLGIRPEKTALYQTLIEILFPPLLKASLPVSSTPANAAKILFHKLLNILRLRVSR
jgi:hypothetical protein